MLAAIKVFSRHGFEAARAEDIAHAAKIAKGTLYLYFRSKEAVYSAAIAHHGPLAWAVLDAIRGATERRIDRYSGSTVDQDAEAIMAFALGAAGLAQHRSHPASPPAPYPSE